MSFILADTSIWVAHFRRADPHLESLLERDQLICHPLVVIELACGTPPAPRERTLRDLLTVKQAVVATTEEILNLIEREQMFDSGCGAIDLALLASVRMTTDALLWTKDRHLNALANRAGVAYRELLRR